MSLIFKDTKDTKDVSFSQTNKSPTKQAYSFSKASRLEITQRPYCVSLYDLPNTLNKRSAALGHAHRSPRFLSMAPSPGSYDQQDGTLQQLTRKRGYTIGIGRDVEMILTYQQAQSQGIIFKSSSPGVGSYQAKTTLSQISYTMSIKPKYGGISDLFTKNGVPGPGQYQNVAEFNPDGKYIQSKMKNITSIVFSKQNAPRMGCFDDKVPGPGAYQLMTKNGKSNLSTIKNPRFPIIARFAIANSRLPRSSSLGPGSYNLPSEFGNTTDNSSQNLVKK